MSVSIDKTAIVNKGAELGEGVKIGPFCVIASNVKIGDRTELRGFVSVHDFVTLGKDCLIYEYTALGGEPQDHGFKGERSWLEIGDGNLIRENVTINRATGEDNKTLVGDNCFIMDSVHLAHNVRVGNGVTIANKVGLSGFVSVGDHVVFGGMAGVHQFVRIGAYCMIGGLYRVVKDVPPFTLAAGEPLKLKGLNLVGLKRAGFSQATRREILNAYLALYNPARRFTENLDEMRGRLGDFIPEVQNVIKFYDESKRGVTFWDREAGNS